jgi:hypothetical protein
MEASPTRCLGRKIITMKRSAFLIALVAGGVLLGGAQSAMADRGRDDGDHGSRSVRSDWRADRFRDSEIRHERVVEVRDARCDRDEYRAARPFAYIRAVDADRFHSQDCRHR